MEDNEGLNKRSVTEPSTPLKLNSRRESLAIYSQRSRTIFRTSDIHLPPHELSTIAAKLSQESHSAPSSLRRSRIRTRSRPITPLTGRDRIKAGSPGASTPTKNKDRRRSSSSFSMGNKRRKRRSLILTENGGTAFDPNYIGPITIDYLRLFCKVATEEKNQQKNSSSESEKSTSEPQEIAIDNMSGTGSPRLMRRESRESRESRRSSVAREFEDSLPLPDVRGMEIFPMVETSVLEEKKATPEKSPVAPSKKTFSYLERILAAQAKRAKRTDDTTSNIKEPQAIEQVEKVNTTQSTGASVEQEPFVIEDNSDLIKNNTISDFLKIPKEMNDIDQSEELFVPEESPTLDENINPDDEGNTILDNISVNNNVNIQEDIEEKVKSKELIQESDPEGNFAMADNISLELDNSLQENNDIQDERAVSPNAVLNEEYTLDNNFDNDIFDSLSDNNATNENNENMENDDKPLLNNARIITSHKNTTTGANMDNIPLSMIKKLVKSLQIAPLNFNDTSSSKIKEKTTKPKRYSPDIYEFIQQKSDHFILNVVSDLEAYSAHRTNNKGNQINIKDVLLYMNRIKFSSAGDNSALEIDNITDLANKFLPLELLISLDNNLHEAFHRGHSKTVLDESFEDSAIDSE